MPRYSSGDSDDENLPDGMKRVGYDADTQTYTYRDRDGSFWEGEPGARYGVLRESGTAYQPMTLERHQEMRDADRAAWRYMLPFFLLVLVVLLTLFRYLGFGSESLSTPLSCKEGFTGYFVKRGDSCWEIAHDRGIEVAELVRSNEGLNCDLIKTGIEICVPVKT
ncbi:uncharacterized protein RAG0_02359 [Rhynchosporium agropyri]|uniref:LysM domain-containing protein n=1 Tax=Rhynchosporium agropyri TaxID=914238 RepID=A0A1E1K126_9HELO|nr:uncharacterized protein RAG0_02359 [Rhynchosporium agropyri]